MVFFFFLLGLNVITNNIHREEVKLLQRAINEIMNTRLTVSGNFDDSTKHWLSELKNKFHINEDGFGDSVKHYLNDYFNYKYLSRSDIDIIANKYQLTYAQVKTLIFAMSDGIGYDEKGMLKICFNRYLFYKELSKFLPKNDLVLLEKNNASILTSKENESGKSNYNNMGYTRFKVAKKIDNDAAMLSCKLGMFNLSVNEFKACGYNSAKEMFVSYIEREYNQLNSFIVYISRIVGLMDNVKLNDWTTVARKLIKDADKLNMGNILANKWLLYSSI